MEKMRYFKELQSSSARLVREETGASLIEYALVACVVALAAVLTLGNVGVALQNSIWSLLQQAYAAYLTGG